jgi:arginyl-tRNA synthetase
MQNAATLYAPHMLCNYLYELAQQFNNFYKNVPVIKANTMGEKNARLQLVSAVAQVLVNGLSVLGIKTVEKM